jgi:hypothetical protein
MKAMNNDNSSAMAASNNENGDVSVASWRNQREENGNQRKS